MKTGFWLWMILVVCAFRPLMAEGEHSIGVGANYWTVIDDINLDDVDEDGFSYLFAYRYSGGLLSVQAEVETFPEDFAGSPTEIYVPKAMVIVGEGVFAGLGVGMPYADGEFADDPVYFLRAGFSLAVFHPLRIDLHANYVFSDFDALDAGDIDTDTLTLGAMARLKF